MKSLSSRQPTIGLLSILVTLAFIAAACSSTPAVEVVEAPAPATSSAPDETSDDAADEPAPAATETPATEEPAESNPTVTIPASCDDTAALFATAGSANADLDDPESSATCDGDNIVVISNGIPDYTYIGTSPGTPSANALVFTIPAVATMADVTTAVPDLGTAAVTLSGVPIYGPTEGTGGDVLSLEGALSECGSHMGPTGFHIHQILTSANTDCLFSPADVAAAPQLVGYAFDGYPIYTGIDQYTSSWELTDESLFASDTWSAHSYVEGSGDLDQCNGLTDAEGNYAYYTTATFPYVIGCYSGVVDVSAAGGGGGGGR